MKPVQKMSVLTWVFSYLKVVRTAPISTRLKLTGIGIGMLLAAIAIAGCTVKAVGDPNRPITINANVVVDIRGLKQTATNIEDMVAQGASK
ncbi:MAG: hypothetical protein V1673_01830 [Candidatus Omnitrophota bacterium]